MGWYIRKSFSTGPVRFNLSKSGLGLSLGIKGARWGIGPRGAYTHLGRYGLYYRSSYSGSSLLKTHSQNRSEIESSSSESSVLFKDKQINYRNLTMEIEFKKKRTREILYSFAAVASFIFSGLFFEKKVDIVGYFFIMTGFLFILSMIIRFIKHGILGFKSDRLYKEMTNSCEIREDGVIVNLERLRGAINIYMPKLEESYMKRAFLFFYRDYLDRMVFDAKISEKEEEELKKVEEILNLDKDLVFKLKLWAFNKAYLRIIEDKILSKEEETEIFRIKNILGLSDNDISLELETLDVLREARRIQEGFLDPITVDIQLTKDELCYHKTSGRIVKDKTLYTYQSEGVRHNVKGLVAEREGDLYLTSKRIFLVGEGVSTIKLEKIFNIESDIDKNLISLDIEGRKNTLRVTTPDTLIFSAKLDKLINTSKTDE